MIGKAKERLRSPGLGERHEWGETGLRDGQRIIADLYNDRELLPDNKLPAAFERFPRNRSRTIHSLFGPFELRRNYLHNAKVSGCGRFPLDNALGLEGAYTPAVAKLMGRAASRAGSYQEASNDLFAYAGLSFDTRDLGRLVATVARKRREALGAMSAAPPRSNSIDVLYCAPDGFTK